MNKVRINPIEVLNAFKQIGYRASDGEYYSLSEKCACGLGAIFISRNQSKLDEFDENGARLNKYFDSEYGADYRLGFVHGFDNMTKRNGREDYVLGYEDGKQSRELCQREGLFSYSLDELDT